MASNKINVSILPIPKIEISNKANWDKVEKGISIMPESVLSGYQKGSSRFSTKLIRVIKKAIQSGNPPPNSGVSWVPLKRPDHPIYYLSGFFYRSIGVYKYKSRTLIGMPIGIKHPGGLTLNQLAIILEYGNSHIPSRPLWAPSLKSVGGVKELKKTLIYEIRRSIISRTGFNANQIKVKW